MMAKAKAKPVLTGRKEATAADNTARKQRGGAVDKTAGEQPKAGKRSLSKGDGSKKVVAYFGEGHGTEDEIAKRCEALPDWETLRPETKAEMIRLFRLHHAADRSPRYEVNEDGEGGRSVDPPGDVSTTLTQLRLVETFASRSNDYVTQRIGDLVNYHRRAGGELTTLALSADLAFVRSGHAEDAVQSTLLTQMAATHAAAMKALGRLNGAEYTETAQLWGNLSTKLLARFTAQAETLAKLQRGGEQIVKHVHIDNRGGQAVVAEQFIKGGLVTNNGIKAMHSAARCLAMTRKGTACQSPAVKGRKRCRMHGGTNPGAPKGNRRALRHGRYSGATLAIERELRALLGTV